MNVTFPVRPGPSDGEEERSNGTVTVNPEVGSAPWSWEGERDEHRVE
ncbi:hypothetical protein [Candidatus Nephthysia bennettiae]|uniref:Uncharacterized protein n=1 Tax=Candidatus Nephthysia bennettiae TaxID=3127016 RepID=A0A934NCR5_9BACT|nr:hypothetical protein [Candidatus Dormibacteraeota bacterium]MBJ7613273.1 hypothetical protein [Candidatus Dormibacteraeota bacterium]